MAVLSDCHLSARTILWQKLAKRPNDLFQERIHLLGRAAHEKGGVEHRIDIDTGKGLILLKTLKQVVRRPLLFHLFGRILAMTTNSFMKILPIPSGPGGSHENILGRHER